MIGKFLRLLLDGIGINRPEELADDCREFDAAGFLRDAGVVGGIELLVEPGEATGERTDGIRIVCPHHHAHGEILERNGRFGDERRAGRLERLRDADGIDDDVVGLG